MRCCEGDLTALLIQHDERIDASFLTLRWGGENIGQLSITVQFPGVHAYTSTPHFTVCYFSFIISDWRFDITS